MDSSILQALKAHIDFVLQENESMVEDAITGICHQLDKYMKSLQSQHH